MSETTMITLLRHGEVELGNVFCGSTDPALSDKGWSQMQKSIEDKEGWDKVISSPLQRCVEFAESLAVEKELECTPDVRFQEIDFGAWDGLSPQEVLSSDPDILNAWWKSPTKIVPPNGEAFLDFRSRVLKAFYELTESNKGSNLLLVTHAGVIRIILMHVLGMQEENLFRLNVNYASISRIRLHHDETGDWSTLISHV